jgi:hypothetical protein
MWVDTSLKAIREEYAMAWTRNQNQIEQIFTRTGVKKVAVRTDADYVKALMQLFRI